MAIQKIYTKLYNVIRITNRYSYMPTYLVLYAVRAKDTAAKYTI